MPLVSSPKAFGYLNVLIADFEEVDDFGGESRCDLHALGMVERPLSLGRVFAEYFECCHDTCLVLDQQRMSLRQH